MKKREFLINLLKNRTKDLGDPEITLVIKDQETEESEREDPDFRVIKVIGEEVCLKKKNQKKKSQ